jgi:hypothetical protein
MSTNVYHVRSDRLRKECLHLGINSQGLSRNEMINELHAKGLYEIDLRFPAKPPLIDTSRRIDDHSNVFLGNGAGLHETRSDRLCIANNDHTALIEGDFAEKRVEIRDVLQIHESQFDADTPGNEGDLRRTGGELYMYRKTGVHPGWYPLQFGSVMIV